MKEDGGGVNQSKKTQNWHRMRQGIKAVTTIVSQIQK